MTRFIARERAVAKQQGKDKFFTGRPCVRGHVVERYTATGQCVKCMYDRVREPKRRKENNEWSMRNYRSNKHKPEFWIRRVLSAIRRRSKRCGISFNLTYEYLLTQIPKDGLCPVLGVPLTYGMRGSHAASVDRIFPSMGYVQGNVCIISFRANSIKYDSVSPTELRKVAAYIERFERVRIK